MAINFDFLNVWKSLTEDEKKKLRDQAQGSLLDVGAEQAPVQEPKPALLDVSEPAPAAEPAKEKRGLFGFDPLGGILPEDPQKREDVLMAMMQGFGGMMAAGGPSREPTNFLQVAGMGLGTGMKGYADARKESREGASLRATSAANQAKAEIEAKANDLIAQWQQKWAGKSNPDGSMPIAAIQELAQVYMSIGERDKAVSLLQEANTYQKKLNSDGMLIGQDGEVSVDDSVLESTTDLSRAKDAGQLTSDQKNYQTYVEQETAAGREPLTMTEWDRANKASGATKVINNNGSNNSKFVEESDKAAAKRFDDIVLAGQSAPQMISDMQTLQELGKNLETGKLAEFKAAIGPYAEMVGINVEGLSDAQAFDAIISRVAPQMRPVGSGATSDFDAKQYLRSLPSLGNTPEGNDIIAYTNKAVAENKIAAAEIARRAQRGDITWQDADAEIAALPNPFSGFREFMKANDPSKPKLLDISEDGQKKPESVPTVNTVEDYHALPSGAKYLDPRTGKVKTKK